jgi:hypothetical protein
MLSDAPVRRTLGTPPSADWFALREAVRDFRPDLIVLVARKMPRMDEAADLRLASVATVISDLAIPFAAPFIRGARVALIDDSVNVGSTLLRAMRRLQAHGAAEVRPFALHSRERNRTGTMVELGGLQLVASDPYNEQLWREAANQAPILIAGLNKPYDLDFPVLDCTLEDPVRTPDELSAGLSLKHGQRAFDVSTALGRERNLHRFSVDRKTTDGVFTKVRLYLDGETGQVNVVPMAIPSPLVLYPTASAPTWACDAYERLVEAAGPLADDELRARAALFVNSLLVGVDFLLDVDGVIRPRTETLVDHVEAQLIFGPVVRNLEFPSSLIEAQTAGADDIDVDRADLGVPPLLAASPALEKLWPQIADRANALAQSADPIVRAVAVFECLSASVGSNDIHAYHLDWPYSRQEVLADPYLRLRIGFTAADLTAILRQVAAPEAGDGRAWHRTTSKVLDRLIDCGIVVPTIAELDGRLYRVYRKGESGARDETVDRVLLGLAQYGDDGLARTRMSKVAVITSFLMPTSSAAHVASYARGNVLTLDEDVIDNETEIVGFLTRTGKVVRKSSSQGE